MSGSGIDPVNEALGRIFPERRVYVRTDAWTRYWTVTPVSQCGLAVVLAAGIGWGAFTSYAFVDRALDGRTVENRIEATESAYEAQLAAMREQQRLLEEELNRSSTRGDAVTRQLSEKQRTLVETATRYQAARAELDGLRAEVAALTGDRRDAQARIGALSEQVEGLRLALADAARRDTAMDATFETFSRSMAEVIAARDTAARRAATLDSRVAALESEVLAWQQRQETLLAEIEDATNSSLTTLNDILIDADIDVEDILGQARRDYTGKGGIYEPFLEEWDEDAEAAPAQIVPEAEGGVGGIPLEGGGDGDRLASLMGDLERVSLMRIAVDRLPFGMPTTDYRITSNFGSRSDPFRHRSAFHSGLDLAAPKGTPIYSTAEGVVVFSGRERGYGNVVKIRHAFGFETVYAHLSRSRVKVGDRVERGSLIADMGSTGRSTGSHLHYEVRIDGQAVNPIKFIRAARHVL